MSRLHVLGCGLALAGGLICQGGDAPTNRSVESFGLVEGRKSEGQPKTDVENKAGEGRKSGGRLQAMEVKARAYDRLAVEKAAVEARLQELERSIDLKSGSSASNYISFIMSLSNQVCEATNRIAQLETETNTLRQVIDEMVLGRFEYYETKAGDTFETIAARLTVYSDAKRGAWLRQFNRQRVRNPDRIEVGEVIVVPRFRPGATWPDL